MLLNISDIKKKEGSLLVYYIHTFDLQKLPVTDTVPMYMYTAQVLL